MAVDGRHTIHTNKMSAFTLLLTVVLALKTINAQPGLNALVATTSQVLFKTIGGCRDVYPDPKVCNIWRNAGQCQGNPYKMHRYCRATCGACKSPIGDCLNGALDMVCDKLALTKQCGKSGNMCKDSCKPCSEGANNKEYLLSLYTTTWNAANKSPEGLNLVKWAGVEGTQRPDIVVLGMQEMGNPNQWLAVINLIMTSRHYVLVKGQSMGQITELVYIKKFLAPAVSQIKTATKGTGLGEVYVNKGGVIISFFLGDTSLAFVTSHLAAHQTKVQERIKDWQQIYNHRMFGFAPNLPAHEYVFWQGDLNFRIDAQKPVVERAIKQRNLAALLPHDQLRKAYAAGLIFNGFEEAPINFAPTYKFDEGTNTYDTGPKQRVPSWTDRILWREKKNSRQINRVIPLEYFSLPQYTASDHKPVALLALINI